MICKKCGNHIPKGERFCGKCGSGIGMNDTVYRVVSEVKKAVTGKDDCIKKALAAILAGGHILIWFGLTWSLELYQQANERLNRPGQKNVCRVYHLVLKGTHDERVLKSLKNKDIGQAAAIEALRLEIVKEAKQ